MATTTRHFRLGWLTDAEKMPSLANAGEDCSDADRYAMLEQCPTPSYMNSAA